VSITHNDTPDATGMTPDQAPREIDAHDPVTKIDGTDNANGRKPVDWLSEIRGLALLLLAVLTFHSLIAKPFYIPSMSMMPNLLVGDRLIVSKYPYGWSWVSASFHILPPFEGKFWGRVPEYGDIVIVTPPGTKTDYIKRVIARPGDTIELRSGRVLLNGVTIPQDVQPNLVLPIDPNSPCDAQFFGGLKTTNAEGQEVCELPILRETLPNGVSYNTIDLGPNAPLDNYGPISIPDNHIFVLGDNRDRSADSRATLEELGLGGPIPLENVGGRGRVCDILAGWVVNL
jgi:signal peptidase I